MSLSFAMAPKWRAIPTAFSCPNGKVRYSTERIAEKQIPRLREWYETHGIEQMPKRVYRCRYCSGWHVTSKEYA